MVKGRAKRKIYFAGGSVLSAVNKIIPKNKKKILIFCKGELYDNSETLFGYLMSHKFYEKYEIVCAVGKPQDYQKLVRKNVRFVNLAGSLKEIMTAGFIFYHGEILAIMPTKDQVSIDYWHGTPLKKINHMLEDKLGDYHYDFFTYLTAPSEMFRPIMAEAFDCKLNQVIIAGHPRNDDLFSKKDEFHKLDIVKEDYNKVFAWMPTYRISHDKLIMDSSEDFVKNAGIPLFHTAESFTKLNAYMEAQNSLLLIKLHPAQNLEALAVKDMSHIKILTNAYLDQKRVRLYRLLKDTDALITDYSSVYFDYLLLDKPEAFIVEDMKEYGSHRGFVVDNPLDYMPGEIIESQEGFYKFLENCMEGRDAYKDKRREINEKVNHYKGGGNCQRLLKLAGISK